MRISSTGAIEVGRVLYIIGRIEATSAWYPENGAPLQDNWRELILRELIRKAEDIDADAIIRVDYQTGPPNWPRHSYRRDWRETQTHCRHRHCGQAFLRGYEKGADSGVSSTSIQTLPISAICDDGPHSIEAM